MSDLEGYERAYRLRNSADDDLLNQVFGKDNVAALTASRPTVIETARAYFPHLTSSTCERLLREPGALQQEWERCGREMEQLAVQEYGAFIGSAKVTQSVQEGLGEIQRSLDSMEARLEPLQRSFQGFQAVSGQLAARRASLRGLMQQQANLQELLELPTLLEACVRNQMYEESLELLAYCQNLLSGHEARQEEVPVLAKLQQQLSLQRQNLHTSLLQQLRSDIHLPGCVRVMGFLRRIKRHSEEELRCLFIHQRRSFLEGHKQQVELMRSSPGSVVAALRNAADLLRTHVYDVGTQYKALFPQEDGPLGVWLSEQIAWLTGLLREHLLPRCPPKASEWPLAAKPAGALAAGTAGWGLSPVVRLQANDIATILRQCHVASSTLKRLGGEFFPSVAGIFEACLEEHVHKLLNVAHENFHGHLEQYDWIPSTALVAPSSTIASPGAPAATAAHAHAGSPSPSPGITSHAGGPSYLHPRFLELTRHKPLALFTNDLVAVFNELRVCTLYSLRASVTLHCSESLSGAVNLLRSVHVARALLPGSSKAAEFERMCQHFAHILLPLVASHLEQLFGPVAQLDTRSLREAMVPDLLPAASLDQLTQQLEESLGGEGEQSAEPRAEPRAEPELQAEPHTQTQPLLEHGDGGGGPFEEAKVALGSHGVARDAANPSAAGTAVPAAASPQSTAAAA